LPGLPRLPDSFLILVVDAAETLWAAEPDTRTPAPGKLPGPLLGRGGIAGCGVRRGGTSPASGFCGLRAL